MGIVLYAALAALVGLVAGRWWAVGVPPSVGAVWVLGVSRDVWGAGLGDYWELAFAVVVTASTVATIIGVLMRKAWSRRRVRASAKGPQLPRGNR